MPPPSGWWPKVDAMATIQFEVTATALNLRAAPDRQGAILTVLLRGQTVIAAGEAVSGWLPVVHEGRHGFVSGAFVRALGIIGSAPLPSPLPAAVPLLSSTEAEDVNQKRRDLAHLHPYMRQRVQQVLQQMDAEGLGFRIFEAYRSPERQQWLFAQGRTRPGGKVTNAEAWKSFHQFGLAVDLVQFGPHGWSWDDSGGHAADWKRMQDIVAGAGLRTLKFERPHAELPVSLADWEDGTLLAGGDTAWRDNLAAAAARWRAAGGSGAPTLKEAERPPLPADAI